MTWPRMGRVTAATNSRIALVRQTHGSFDNAAPQDPGCSPLLVGKAAVKPIDQNVGVNESRKFVPPTQRSIVKPIDQNVGVNESRHACKDPLSSSLCRPVVSPLASPGAEDGVWSLGRTNAALNPCPRALLVSLWEPLESHRPPRPNRFRRRDEYRTFARLA